MAILRLLARANVGLAFIPPIVVRDELAASSNTPGSSGPRIGELMLARHNARRLLHRGGIEGGRRHYVLILALHSVAQNGSW